MNKKHAVLVMTSLFLSVFSLFPITKTDSRKIRKELYAASENNLLSVCQLVEPGLSAQEVIDRDLQIMIEHRDLLQRRLDVYKGFTFRNVIPCLDKIGVVVSGLVAAVTGYFGADVLDACKRFYDGNGNFLIKGCNDLVDNLAKDRWISQKDRFDYMAERIKSINKEDPHFNEAVAIGCGSLVVSAAFGYLFIKGFYNAYKYHGRLDEQAKKVKICLGRDQKVIAQLKEIKYSLQG